jgi:tryptophanyl-tRNA synthetase
MTKVSRGSPAEGPRFRTTTGRPRILTGDTPTGRLHLGHFVGSLENRVRLQDSYDCYFLIANVHAFTTRADKSAEIRRDTIDIVRDWLAVGIDPERSTLVLQSEIPAIAELTWYLAMQLPFARVMRNPTLKDELAVKGLGEHYSFGFPLYAVGQCADILAFRAHLVPVGEDQAAHIEMCREVARRFNQVYGSEVFPIPDPLIGRIARLVGIDGVQKMSKSLGNAIFLSDDAAAIRKKMGQLYTGRQSMEEPGDPNNALFQYACAFMKDEARVAELAERYAKGGIGDGEIKREVAGAIDELLAPMRERRAHYEGPAGEAKILELLREHAARANAVADETLALAKQAMHLVI